MHWPPAMFFCGLGVFSPQFSFLGPSHSPFLHEGVLPRLCWGGHCLFWQFVTVFWFGALLSLWASYVVFSFPVWGSEEVLGLSVVPFSPVCMPFAQLFWP